MTRSLRVRRLERVPQALVLVKVLEGDHVLDPRAQEDFVQKNVVRAEGLEPSWAV